MNPIVPEVATIWNSYVILFIYFGISMLAYIYTRHKIGHSNPSGFKVFLLMLVAVWAMVGALAYFERPSKPFLFSTLFFIIIFVAFNVASVFAIYHPLPKMGFFASLFYELFGSKKAPADVLDNLEE